MKIGEVCLVTQDVPRLAGFYRFLLGIEEQDSNLVHQTILAEEAQLTIWNDGMEHGENGRNIQLAFTVRDVDCEFERLSAAGVEMIEPPQTRPWGAKNMHFRDPDGNDVYFRSFPKEAGII